MARELPEQLIIRPPSEACSALVNTFFTCDHANNYVRVEGQLMSERDAMLSVVNKFLAQPEAQRKAHYKLVGNQL
jgi:hypothetical protein